MYLTMGLALCTPATAMVVNLLYTLLKIRKIHLLKINKRIGKGIDSWDIRINNMLSYWVLGMSGLFLMWVPLL